MYEVACNLLRPDETTPGMVLKAAEAAASRAGVRVLDDYTTGVTEKEAVRAITRILSERERRSAP